MILSNCHRFVLVLIVVPPFCFNEQGKTRRKAILWWIDPNYVFFSYRWSFSNSNRSHWPSRRWIVLRWRSTGSCSSQPRWKNRLFDWVSATLDRTSSSRETNFSLPNIGFSLIKMSVRSESIGNDDLAEGRWDFHSWTLRFGSKRWKTNFFVERSNLPLLVFNRQSIF